LELWDEGWSCLFDALETINQTNFGTIIYIRSQGHSIVEAVNRQLCHYSYHIGQIVYIGREKSDNWTSLSIPKGESQKFNDLSFEKGKRVEHFSDKFLKKND